MFTAPPGAGPTAHDDPSNRVKAGDSWLKPANTKENPQERYAEYGIEPGEDRPEAAFAYAAATPHKRLQGAQAGHPPSHPGTGANPVSAEAPDPDSQETRAWVNGTSMMNHLEKTYPEKTNEETT